MSTLGRGPLTSSMYMYCTYIHKATVTTLTDLVGVSVIYTSCLFFTAASGVSVPGEFEDITSVSKPPPCGSVMQHALCRQVMYTCFYLVIYQLSGVVIIYLSELKGVVWGVWSIEVVV